MTGRVDDDFRTLPLEATAAAGLERARGLGASTADVRVQRMRHADVCLRDGKLSSASDDSDLGLGVRVLVDGVWGFAAVAQVGPDAAADAAAQAVEMARVCAPLTAQRVELADEPVHAGAEWVSPYRIDPFGVDQAERAALLQAWSAQLLSSPAVTHVDATLTFLKEQKYYADLAGTTTLQQRVLAEPVVTVVAVPDDGAGSETMRTLAPASARGWEYVLGEGWDWETELAELPDHLAQRVAAPSVEPGIYDLVIAPSNLWLTIHESIGHATELDRALGYEAAYAGTSFATIDKLGTLKYGSELLHVRGDRTTPHGCATVGYDDEGVETTSWDIVRDGILVGYQLDRRMAREQNLGRSNGCAYADSARNVPVQRMANVSVQPRPGGPSLDDLLSGVDDGLFVVGDKSWSIDMQRYNFQFTAQRFYRITAGRLAGQVKDAAYQGSTPSFWASLAGVGGPDTFVLHAASNCGKAQPAQGAWVSHGAPVTVFRGVNVLNTKQEAGQ